MLVQVFVNRLCVPAPVRVRSGSDSSLRRYSSCNCIHASRLSIPPPRGMVATAPLPGEISIGIIGDFYLGINTAAGGWTFGAWGGACTGSSPSCTLTMSQNQSVTATFTQLSYTLTVSATGSGTVTSGMESSTVPAPALTAIFRIRSSRSLRIRRRAGA